MKKNNDKINIVYITQSFGGVEIYIRQIIEHLDYSKFTLSIIAPQNDNFIRFCEKYRVSYYIVDMSRGLSPLVDIMAYWKIKHTIKKISPDLIHLHSAKAGFLGRLALRNNKKLKIYTPHGMSYQSFTGVKRAIFFLCEVIVRKYTDKVLACSYSEAKRIQYDVGISGKKITTLCNSTTIPKELIRKRTIVAEEDIHIGSIMRLTIAKNPILYVEVAQLLSKKYNNIHFSILGAGLTDDLKEQVIKKIDDYHLSNKFEILEWGQQSKSLDYLDSIDIFILPSLFEGFPLSPLEAMSRGVPCVLSKGYGCIDLVNNGENGFSCNTAEQYVDAITKLIEHPKLRDQIVSDAFEYISVHHNVLAFVKEIESYYATIYNETSK